MDPQRLEAFVGVARSGGFSRAARALGRTQSSVSEAVARLEEELHRPLFVRTTRTTTLTEAGATLLAHAERILDEIRAAKLHLEEDTQPEGEIVVGTSDTLACYLLPPVFAALRKQHPGIQLRLDNRPSPRIAVEVAERRLSVGVLSLPLPPGFKGELTLEPVTEYQDVVICSPRHPLARRRWLTVAQLRSEPLLLLDRSTGTRALLDRAFNAPANVVMETPSVDVLKRLVELDFGVSVVPSLSVAREQRAKTLVVMPLRGVELKRTVGLATHPRAPLPKTARAFIEMVRRYAG